MWSKIGFSLWSFHVGNELRASLMGFVLHAGNVVYAAGDFN